MVFGLFVPNTIFYVMRMRGGHSCTFYNHLVENNRILPNKNLCFFTVDGGAGSDNYLAMNIIFYMVHIVGLLFQLVHFSSPP